MKIAVLNTNGVQTNLGNIKKCYYLVEDDYDFSGNAATDVTSLDNIKLFYSLLRIDYISYREYLTSYLTTNPFSGLDLHTKGLMSRHFIVGKSDRDTVHTINEQEEFALDFQEKLTEAEIKYDLTTNIDNVINKDPNEFSIVGELPNYRELDETIEPSFVGTWYPIELPNSVAPNSIIMVSCRSSRDNRVGGVREVGSSIDRRKSLNKNGSFTLLVKVNNNRKVELYAQTNHINFYINAQIS